MLRIHHQIKGENRSTLFVSRTRTSVNSPSCKKAKSAPRFTSRLGVKNPALCHPAISARWNGPARRHSTS